MLSSFTSTVFAEDTAAKNPAPPNINGASAITIDVKTGEIIYAKDADKKMYPASTTKLLTALLLAENKKKGDMLSYTASAKKQPEYSLNVNFKPIPEGEKISAQNVMDGLLIFSGNDLAYVIADNVSGNSENFATLMNDKIKKLGLQNTHYVTPNGLHDNDHYTTAYDLSVILREAWKNDWIRETMAKPTSVIKTENGPNMEIKNSNKLLGKEGCLGGKTGYTIPAGRCLTAVFERDGRQIAGVVMKSVYDKDDKFVFDDMLKIINWSYAATPGTLFAKGETLKTETLKYKPLKFFGPEKSIEATFYTDEDVKFYENAANNKDQLKKNATYDLGKYSMSDLKNGKKIGTVTINEKGAKKSYALYGKVDSSKLMKNNLPIYGIFAGATILAIAVIFILAKSINSTLKKRRRGKYY